MQAEEGTMNPVDADRHSRIGRAEVTEGSQTTTHQAVISRRAAIGGAIGGALVTALARPELATALGRDAMSLPLVLLLRGVYQPVVDGPDLGLSMVDLNDGSYSTTKIYPVSGIRDHSNVLEAIGDSTCSSAAACAPTTSPEARLRCSSRTRIPFLSPMGRVGLTCTGPSNWTYRRRQAVIDPSWAVTTRWSTSCISSSPVM